MSRGPLSPPWWHVRFWYHYWRSRRSLDRAVEETCQHGCCVRWVDKHGRDLAGVNPAGVDHFA